MALMPANHLRRWFNFFGAAMKKRRLRTRCFWVNKGSPVVASLITDDPPEVDFEFRINCAATREDALAALRALEQFMLVVGPPIEPIAD
jgi:hypothetical protein